jgi:predicted GNAT superfamily acetyltransferase
MTTHAPPIIIRELSSLADYDACVALQDDTWGHGFSERVPGAILRVSQKIGGVAAGAFDANGRMLGFVFGMTGLQHGQPVHWSDMLAVRPEARGLGLGELLKAHQRDVVLPLGVHTMLWTADPLVARNAHFNINHLGAFPGEYVENMYGEHTGSVLHGAMPTDRFVYHWALDAQVAVSTRSGRAEPEDAALPLAIAIEPDGTPLAIPTADATAVRVTIPHDLSAVQATSLDRARAWRIAVRAAITARFAQGLMVTRFVRGHDDNLPYYVLSATR